MLGFTLALSWAARARRAPVLPRQCVCRRASSAARPAWSAGSLRRQFGLQAETRGLRAPAAWQAVRCAASKSAGRSPEPEPALEEEIDEDEAVESAPAPKEFVVRRGTLYVVATPIGNLQDITLRALSVLKQVDAIAAEDTRHTLRLLRHFGIQAPLISHHEHNVRERVPELVDRLAAGESIAVVSDAGTPGISDPGAELVRACVSMGIPVTPVPGACAAAAAVSASGMLLEGFTFLGFLPAHGRERREAVESLRDERRPFILYEAPHRLLSTLEALEGVLGGSRPIVVTRELTKVHEEFLRTTISQARAEFERREPRGEFTLIVSGPPEGSTLASEGDATSTAALTAELEKCFEAGIAVSEAAKLVAGKTGAKKKAVYELALQLRKARGA